MQLKYIVLGVLVCTIVLMAVTCELMRRTAAYERSISEVDRYKGKLIPDKRPFIIEGMMVDLSYTRIDDEGMGRLRGLKYGPQFRINLSNTAVTDRGLEYLHGLPVAGIVVKGTSITPAGVERLRASIPKAIMVDGRRKTHSL